MRFFPGLVAILLFSSFAQADTYRHSVPANKTSGVGARATYDQNCYPSAIPRMKIAKEPEHGSVTFKQVSFKLNDSAGKCAGRSVKGTAIYYKPKRGYHGKDEFKVQFTMFKYSGGSNRVRNVQDKYIIEVK